MPDPSTEPVSLTVTVETDPGKRLDVTLTAPQDALMGSVLAPLGHAAGVPGRLLLGGARLDPDRPWLTGGLRNGSVLCAYGPAGPQACGALELRVVAGPSAGLVAPVPPEGAVLGRSGGTLVLDDAEVSRQHAGISYEAAGTLAVHDLASTNGLALDGALVASAAGGVGPGAVLSLGESRVQVAVPRDDRAALTEDGRGRLVLNRPPRRRTAPSSPVEVRLPAEPAPPERGRIPLAALLVPLVLGAVLFLTMPSSPQYLLLMAMSPLMLVGNAVTDRRSGRRRHRAAVREHTAAVAAVRDKVDLACHVERAAMHEAAPDPAELAGRAMLPSSRLWERRGSDPDACSLRLGVADRPASVRLVGGTVPAEPPVLAEVPVVLRLDEAPVLGVAGPAVSTAALVRWLVLQSAILQGPDDLRIVVLAPPRGAERWRWLRWLPHATTDDGRRLLLGCDQTSYADRVAELLHRTSTGGGSGDRVLLVVDQAHQLRDVAGLGEVLRRAGELGVIVVCVEKEERLLPQECASVAVFDRGSSTRLTLRDSTGHCTAGVLADQLGADRTDAVARALGALAGSASTPDGGLPATGRLLDLLDLPAPTADAIAAGWLRGGRSTLAVVGWSAGGVRAVDLASDGPHALVAGTTGAGKSELLQTLVASLAVANRPDALQLVLVDYKGGAAFRDCARLPHTVGLVTDLDGRLTERALTSLTAELRRRESVLAEHGVKDLEQLWAHDRGGSPLLARLVIVIDEFATLVEELPDFVRGLVGIAQRGRSLGIHLVLATQRPGGVVSPDIRANTNLRICLRVTQAAESSDVVDSPAAADVPPGLPGRGYLRTAAGSLQLFQAARVGGRWRAPESVRHEPSAEVTDLASLIRSSSSGGRPTGQPDADIGAAIDDPTGARTDLAVLVDAIRDAHRDLALPPAPRPWLDLLPGVIARGELAALPSCPPPLRGVPRVAPTAAAPGLDPVLTLGLADLPDRQQQLPYRMRFAQGGHLLVVGAPRSGRTSLLMTAVAAAAKYDAGDLHVYALDFGNGALAPLARLPHCGTVVQRDEADRLERLLARLQTELDRRQQVLAAGGFADVTEQRRHAPVAERLPWMLLLVDRWEGLVQAYQDVDLGRRLDELLRLLREGGAVGLRAVVTADRSGLLGRLPAVMQDKLLLRLTDRADYALADIPTRAVPSSVPPGRALALGDEPSRTFHEVQIALLSSDPDGRAQRQALRELIDTAVARTTADRLLQPPLRVDALPRRVTVDEALSLGPLAAEASGHWALVGVGGDRLRPVGIDLAIDGPCLLVAGPPRSGRTTALTVMAEALLRAGRRLVLVAPSTSSLRRLAGHAGTSGCLDSDSSNADAGLMLGAGRPVVVVDDAERFTDTPVGIMIEDLLRAGDGPQVIAAGNGEDLQSTYRGFTLEVRRSRCGLLLSPQSTLDGDLVGARLPRTSGGEVQPGRGVLAVRGELTPVQVAQPSTPALPVAGER